MAKLGLYAKLAVNITRRRTDNGIETDPKVDSRGWVACFNEEAAKMVVAGLLKMPTDHAVFTEGEHDKKRLLHNRTLFNRWSNLGVENLTLKDLRRASLHWLGYNTAVQPVELMKHARHTDFETTTLYLRRPGEDVPESGDLLDLDA